MNGEHVGAWTMDRRGHKFEYSEDWLANPLTRPLSLSMPLRAAAEPYTGARVESFFDNLLPDSIDIRRRIQGRVGASSVRAFDLLGEIGNDCIGAVQLVHQLDDASNVGSISGEPLSASQVAARLRGSVTAGIPGVSEDDFLRLSLAGAQEKTGLLWHGKRWYKPTGATPTTHIIKLPMGRVGIEQADLSTSVENEWLCSRLLHAYGLPVANADIVQFDDDLTALVVERFDRRLASNKRWWIRVPQEDFCQATGTSSAQKYQADGGPGIEQVMQLLLGSVNAKSDRLQFLTSQVLFWLLCAPDGHAKNFSVFIEAQGRYRLTPMYDVISAYPFIGRGRQKIAAQRIKLAMAWLGRNRHYGWSSVQYRHLHSTAHKTGMQAEIDGVLARIVDNTGPAIESVNSSLPAGFPQQVADTIFTGLREKVEKLG